MNILLKNAHVHAPADLGTQDILVVGSHIVAMGKDLSVSLPGLETVDMKGIDVIPGLVDQHVHVLGGGGEDGCASRVPPIAFSDCVKAGVTTIVGVLGTDGHTRTVRDLVAMTMGLEHDGVTAYCRTGSYEIPSPTLTGSVEDDIVFVKPIIGCKLAISDHRCSCPTTEEIIRLVSQCRLGGMIGGKVGDLHIHVGADPCGIEQLFEISEKTIIPITQFRPTHMGKLLDQSEKLVKMGGYTDITSGEKAAAQCATLLSRLTPEEGRHVTMSSDSNGSIPRWNEKREIIGMDRGRMTTLLQTVRAMVDLGVDFTTAISPCTANVADALKFSEAGHIGVGYRADLLALDGWEPVSVMAKGRWLMKNGKIVRKGMFEE